jgi:hypothetical protein
VGKDDGAEEAAAGGESRRPRSDRLTHRARDSGLEHTAGMRLSEPHMHDPMVVQGLKYVTRVVSNGNCSVRGNDL